MKLVFSNSKKENKRKSRRKFLCEKIIFTIYNTKFYKSKNYEKLIYNYSSDSSITFLFTLFQKFILWFTGVFKVSILFVIKCLKILLHIKIYENKMNE